MISYASVTLCRIYSWEIIQSEWHIWVTCKYCEHYRSDRCYDDPTQQFVRRRTVMRRWVRHGRQNTGSVALKRWENERISVETSCRVCAMHSSNQNDCFADSLAHGEPPLACVAIKCHVSCGDEWGGCWLSFARAHRLVRNLLLYRSPRRWRPLNDHHLLCCCAIVVCVFFSFFLFYICVRELCAVRIIRFSVVAA